MYSGEGRKAMRHSAMHMYVVGRMRLYMCLVSCEVSVWLSVMYVNKNGNRRGKVKK